MIIATVTVSPGHKTVMSFYRRREELISINRLRPWEIGGSTVMKKCKWFFYDHLRIRDSDFYRERISVILPRRDRCLFIFDINYIAVEEVSYVEPGDGFSFNFYDLENIIECCSCNYCEQKLVAIKLRCFKDQQFYCKAMRFMGDQHSHSRVIWTRVLGATYGSQAWKVSENSER